MEKALKKAFEMYPDTALDTVYGYQISKGKRDAFMNGVKWRESQNSSTSDEALPIADVVGQSEQLKAFNEVFQIAWELVQDESDYTRLLKIKESL